MAWDKPVGHQAALSVCTLVKQKHLYCLHQRCLHKSHQYWKARLRILPSFFLLKMRSVGSKQLDAMSV